MQIEKGKMKLTYHSIGRIISALNPEMIKEIVENYQQLSSDVNIIPRVMITMDDLFPGMIEWERRTFFVALVYRIFRPGSFLPPFQIEGENKRRAVSKLPRGVRGALASCMHLPSPELASHYKRYAEAHVNNPRYRAKMRQVTDALGLTEPPDQKSS